jgi:hypothetical protein
MQSSEFLFKKTFELSTKGLFTFIVCAKVFVRPLDESLALQQTRILSTPEGIDAFDIPTALTAVLPMNWWAAWR